MSRNCYQNLVRIPGGLEILSQLRYLVSSEEVDGPGTGRGVVFGAWRNGARAVLAAVLILAHAPDIGAEDLTADEMLSQASTAFAEANWERAASLYRTFLINFGEAEEVKRLLPDIRYRLAIAALQNKEFAAAGEVIVEALASEPPLELPQRQELTFWLGVCRMQAEDYPGAREALESFIALFPNPQEENPIWRMRNPIAAKLPEARLLMGATYLLQDQFVEGADYLQEIKANFNEENRGRATILELYGLLSAGETDPEQRARALDVVVEEFPRLDELTQLAAFQTMTLQLGATLLEQGEYRQAIRCLQRIWPSERLLRHQTDRLTELESRLAALEANPRSDPYQKFLVQQMIIKVRREIANFQEIEDFDAALRLRLATAFQTMERYREAALILAEMLNRMPPGPIVESAAVNLIQCWNAIDRWDQVVASAAQFEETFPRSEQLPLVLYLRGLAEQQDSDYEAAMATFERIVEKFPRSEFAGRAFFMIGFTSLLAEEQPRAIKTFAEFPRKYAKHDLEEPAHYWLGMAHSLAGESEETRDVLADYLKKYPEGSFVGAATFRRAYAAQQMMDFETSRAELEAFLETFPGHENEAEARILLADALMNDGFMEEGLAVLALIPPEQTRFFEEGWFKAGRALKAMEENERLYAHMVQFREEHPLSPRVPEALFHAGWVLRQDGRDEEARQLYWDALAEFGNNPAARGVEDLFSPLTRLYEGEEGLRQYLARVRDLREDKEPEDPITLRSLWAEARGLQKTDPERARHLLLEGGRQADVRFTSPQILADIADARLQVGDTVGAKEMFADLIKWNPRAPQKDRALAELGLLEKRDGRSRAALEHFDRFLRETFGSRQTGRVLLAKAALEHERGQNQAAINSLEQLLASEATTGQEKAEALFRIGEIHLADGKPALAVPYFQRIYIMHGRWRDWVAKAYLHSGEAFEKLKDTEAARRTYAEFLAQPELEDFAEAETARRHLKRLGGPLPEEPALEQSS
jgi:TolA-binding protein